MVLQRLKLMLLLKNSVFFYYFAGAANYVYPGANHTRHDHSIG